MLRLILEGLKVLTLDASALAVPVSPNDFLSSSVLDVERVDIRRGSANDTVVETTQYLVNPETALPAIAALAGIPKLNSMTKLVCAAALFAASGAATPAYSPPRLIRCSNV